MPTYLIEISISGYGGENAHLTCDLILRVGEMPIQSIAMRKMLMGNICIKTELGKTELQTDEYLYLVNG